MMTGSVIAGSGEAGAIVWTPAPGISKLIVWTPGVGIGVQDRLAERAGAAVVGVGDGERRDGSRSRENSDVLPFGSVAVAVMDRLAARARAATTAVKLALPEPSVVTIVTGRGRSGPAPKPEGSAAALAKNWMVKAVFGVLLSVPVMVVLPVPGVAEVRTGSSGDRWARCAARPEC